MDFWIQLLGTVLLASLFLFLFFKLSNTKKKNENSFDSKRKGSTILITGPSRSGKTFLYQKLVEAPRILKTAHSLKPNTSSLGRWKVIDLPLDSQKLHSQPADYFHFNDLATLILCIKSSNSELELIATMTFAVGVLKNVPLCVLEQESNSDKEIFLSKLLRSLNNLQQSRLAALLSSDSSSSIAFDDPINRLVFETPEGEVSTEYESRLRKYLDESVTICNKDSDAVKEWLDQQTL